MKKHPGKCKICGIDLALSIADDYPVDRDPKKLIPMATCNSCFDLRERRIKIETGLKRVCHRLMTDERMDDKTKNMLHETVRAYAGKYSRWCGDLLRRQHAANVGFLVSAILEQPDRWYNHLRDFETAANNS